MPHASFLKRARIGALSDGTAMNRLAGFTPALDYHRWFVVSQNQRGQWIARETTGLVGGVFRSQRNAVHFVPFETGSPDSATLIAGRQLALAAH